MTFRKTTSLARELGVNVHQIYEALRMGKLPEPRRDDIGDFVWQRQDVERLRQALGLRTKRSDAALSASAGLRLLHPLCPVLTVRPEGHQFVMP